MAFTNRFLKEIKSKLSGLLPIRTAPAKMKYGTSLPETPANADLHLCLINFIHNLLSQFASKFLPEFPRKEGK
jgi:hypothetical protein